MRFGIENLLRSNDLKYETFHSFLVFFMILIVSVTN